MADIKYIKEKYPLICNFMIATWNETATYMYTDLEDAVTTHVSYTDEHFVDKFTEELLTFISDEHAVEYVKDHKKKTILANALGHYILDITDIPKILEYLPSSNKKN